MESESRAELLLSERLQRAKKLELLRARSIADLDTAVTKIDELRAELATAEEHRDKLAHEALNQGWSEHELVDLGFVTSAPRKPRKKRRKVAGRNTDEQVSAESS